MAFGAQPVVYDDIVAYYCALVDPAGFGCLAVAADKQEAAFVVVAVVVLDYRAAAVPV